MLSRSEFLRALGDVSDPRVTGALVRAHLPLYADDPVGFGEEILGERYTDDVKQMMRSLVSARVVIGRSGNATGKCVGALERIRLADGTTVAAGSLVGRAFKMMSVVDGELRAVPAYATDNGEVECVEIETDRGVVMTRTVNHPFWSGRLGATRKPCPIREVEVRGWVEAGSLCIGDLLAGVTAWPHGTCSLPGDWCDLLGYLLGDGCMCGCAVSFSQLDGEVLDHVRSIVRRMGCEMMPHGACNWRIVRYGSSNPVIRLMKLLGVWGKLACDKRIPREVMTGNADVVVRVLRGLFATDGWVHAKRIEVGLCSVSRGLLEDVQHLLLRFGIVAVLRSKRTTWTHRGVHKQGTAYTLTMLDRINVSRFAQAVGFYGKKQQKLEAALDQLDNDKCVRKWRSVETAPWFRWEKIRRVTPIGVVPTVAITVPEHHTYVQDYWEHNSHSLGALALWWLFCRHPSKVFTAAAPPEENLRKLVWGSIHQRVQDHPWLFEGAKVTDLEIKLGPEHYCTGVTIPTTGTEAMRRSRFSGKHSPNLLFLMDEGDAIPPEIYDGAESCMSDTRSRMLITFNPRAEEGPVWQKEVDGQALVVELSELRHPNVVSGENQIPGAVTRDVVIQRFHMWTEECQKPRGPDACCFEVPWYLVGVGGIGAAGQVLEGLKAGWRRITNPKFADMVLGQYSPIAKGDDYFNVAYLRGLLGSSKPGRSESRLGDITLAGNLEVFEEPQERVEYVIGVDVALGMDERACKDYTTADVFRADTWEHVASYWCQVDIERQAVELDALSSWYGWGTLVVERNNNAFGLLTELERKGSRLYRYQGSGDGKPMPGMPTSMKTKSMVDGCLRSMIEDAANGADSVVLRGPRAIAELVTYTDYSGGRRGGRGKCHDDHVRSIALACWYMKEYVPKGLTTWKPKAEWKGYGNHWGRRVS